LFIFQLGILGKLYITAIQTKIKTSMEKWEHLPQEQEGNYIFSGRWLMSSEVSDKLHGIEIQHIINDVSRAVKEQDGICGLQIFVNKEGVKVYAIYSVDWDQLESGEFNTSDINHNNNIICFPHER
jgi:hypothetical protein